MFCHEFSAGKGNMPSVGCARASLGLALRLTLMLALFLA
jgi:hypothetical protein